MTVTLLGWRGNTISRFLRYCSKWMERDVLDRFFVPHGHCVGSRGLLDRSLGFIEEDGTRCYGTRVVLLGTFCRSD